MYYSCEENNHITSSGFIITNTKLYVLCVTFSINDNIKLLENIKQEVKRTISSNKYRLEITTKPKNNSLDYLINATFRNINRLFALSFKNVDNGATINYFYKHYISLEEIKDFNSLIDNKQLFDQLVKNNQVVYEKLIEMLRNDDYTT